MADKPLNRDSLKAFFQNGNRPTQENFESLINSMLNKVDDGISKNLKDGLILSPESSDSDNLISFYEKIQDDLPQWSIQLKNGEAQGLLFTQPTTGSIPLDVLFLDKGGNVGIQTNNPRTTLEVNGTLGVSTRIGTYKMGTAAANGTWQTILTDLNGCCAFEIMAQVGKEKTGKYALLHAHALSTFGKSKSKIAATQAHYGWWWNKIALRWVGSTYKYSLQIKTRSNYGSDQTIKFYISKLWDNDVMSLFNESEVS